MHKDFNIWAGEYDSSILQRLIFNSVHKEIKRQLTPGKKLLDVGCGTGRLLSKVKRQMSYCAGVDSSEEMVRIAREKGLEVHLSDSASVPFSSNRFDYLVSSMAFHHFQNQEKSIEEFFRVLKPGGKIIIADLRYNIYAGENSHVYSKKEMADVFKKSGFENIKQAPSSKRTLAEMAFFSSLAAGGFAFYLKPEGYASALAATLYGFRKIPLYFTSITSGEKPEKNEKNKNS